MSTRQPSCLGPLLAILFVTPIALAQPHATPESGDPATAARRFVERLAKGEFSAAARDFDDTMQRVVPTEKLKEIWESLIAKVGPLKRQVGVAMERVKEFDVVLVTCEFEKARFDVKVVFDRSRQISGLFFVPTRPAAKYPPPAYAKPAAFREEEVQVGSGEWALPGTLTLPGGGGPLPAVVLVHGSGPNDRDETIGPNKPFRDLAWGLASRGIAVLRYEKRTKEHAGKLLAVKDRLTVQEETIDDALAAVALLRHAEQVDPKRVFVLGHSLGGMLTARIGTLDAEIAGFIALAGTTRPLEDVILAQSTYVLSLEGGTAESDQTKLRQLEEQVARVKDPRLSPDTPSTQLPLGIPARYWLDLRGYHPPEVARALKRPILILQGGRDYQVTEEDFQGWKNALSSQENVRLKLYPKLNHLFMEGEGKSSPVEYERPGHVAEVVVEDIAEWIGQRQRP